ncbi:PREDICTED: transcription factor bHLH148-like [Camelina sativa]|uniref:Transcription factor bHLH148-like n=1 Tax=Camelina sativa TaxID=90675 RepID=A0ABM0XHQ8_CAMSA|nr:PREDICTED: transcription factor bHLH148-like [Camelina sativa]
MASLISDNEPPTSTTTDLVRRKKKKKKRSSDSSAASSRTTAASVSGESHTRWRSEKQQRIYSAKLIQALQQVRLNSSAAATSSPTAQKRGRAVREAADRALAVSARGRTLWSRAILANRIKLKFRKQKRPRAPTTAIPAMMSTNNNRWRKRRVSAVVTLNKKSIPAVNRKVRVLGRLVPGCGKESVPVILEEATDYIQALEMQVRAMNSLAELLSSYGSGSAPPPPI